CGSSARRRGRVGPAYGAAGAGTAPRPSDSVRPSACPTSRHHERGGAVMEVRSIVGDVDEERFARRRCHYVDIGWGDAAKHRQIGRTDTGVQVRIILPRGTFLRDGAVLADDGEQIVVVRRPEEPALAVSFDDNCGADGARRMLLLGYLLGNQHAPIDVADD